MLGDVEIVGGSGAEAIGQRSYHFVFSLPALEVARVSGGRPKPNLEIASEGRFGH